MDRIDTLDNGGNISANEITLNIDDTLNNKENAQISADSQVVINNSSWKVGEDCF
jgi:hypothetical protein